MTKPELIAEIAKETGFTKIDCEKVLNTFTSTITDSLKQGENVRILGFGNFIVKDRAAKLGRNPRTGETVQIAAHKAPVFKAGKGLKASVNG